MLLPVRFFFAFLTNSCLSSITIRPQPQHFIFISAPVQVREDNEGLQTMRYLGENMAWLIKCIQAGKAAGVAEPEQEKRVTTNFIR